MLEDGVNCTMPERGPFLWLPQVRCFPLQHAGCQLHLVSVGYRKCLESLFNDINPTTCFYQGSTPTNTSTPFFQNFSTMNLSLSTVGGGTIGPRIGSTSSRVGPLIVEPPPWPSSLGTPSWFLLGVQLGPTAELDAPWPLISPCNLCTTSCSTDWVATVAWVSPRIASSI